MQNSSLAQTLFECGIANQHRNTLASQFGHLIGIALEDDKGFTNTSQIAYQVRADTSRAADNEMFFVFAHFARTSALAEGRDKFGLNDRLNGAGQREKNDANPNQHKANGKEPARYSPGCD